MDVDAVPIAERLLRSLPVAVVFVDRDGVVFEATDQVHGLLGLAPPDLIGRRFVDLLVADDPR